MKRSKVKDTEGNTVTILTPETPQEAAALQAEQARLEREGKTPTVDTRHSFGDDPDAWGNPREQ